MRKMKLARIVALSLILLVFPLADSFTSKAQSNIDRAGDTLLRDASGDDSFFSWHKQRLNQLGKRLREAPAMEQGFWPDMIVGFSEADREIPIWLEHSSIVYRLFIAPGSFLLTPLGVTADRLIGLSITAILAAFLWIILLRLLWGVAKPLRNKFRTWMIRLRERKLAERLKQALIKHNKVGVVIVIVGLILFLGLGLIALALGLFMFVSIFYPLSFVAMPLSRLRIAYLTARQIMASVLAPSADPESIKSRFVKTWRTGDSLIDHSRSDSNYEPVDWSPYSSDPDGWREALRYFLFVPGIPAMGWVIRDVNAPGARTFGFLLLTISPLLIFMLSNLLHWLLVPVLLPFAALDASIFKRKKEVAVDDSITDAEKDRLKIPDGVTFSDRVLILPAIDSAFDHALRIQQGGTSYRDYEGVIMGEWVNRGDTLYKFSVRRDASLLEKVFGWDWTDISLRSPVSGFVLDTPLFLDKPLGILLPDKEPPAESTEYVFGNLCDYCYEHRSYIFQKPKKLRGSAAYTDEGLKELLAKQRSGNYEIVSARTEYKYKIEYLIERTKELKSYLSHLIESATSVEMVADKFTN